MISVPGYVDEIVFDSMFIMVRFASPRLRAASVVLFRFSTVYPFFSSCPAALNETGF